MVIAVRSSSAYCAVPREELHSSCFFSKRWLPGKVLEAEKKNDAFLRKREQRGRKRESKLAILRALVCLLPKIRPIGQLLSFSIIVTFFNSQTTKVVRHPADFFQLEELERQSLWKPRCEVGSIVSQDVTKTLVLILRELWPFCSVFSIWKSTETQCHNFFGSLQKILRIILTSSISIKRRLLHEKWLFFINSSKFNFLEWYIKAYLQRQYFRIHFFCTILGYSWVICHLSKCSIGQISLLQGIPSIFLQFLQFLPYYFIQQTIGFINPKLPVYWFVLCLNS